MVNKKLAFHPLFVSSAIEVNCGDVMHLRASHFLSDMGILGNCSSALEFETLEGYIKLSVG